MYFVCFQCGHAYVHEDGNLEDAAAENEVRMFLVFVNARIKSLYVSQYYPQLTLPCSSAPCMRNLYMCLRFYGNATSLGDLC